MALPITATLVSLGRLWNLAAGNLLSPLQNKSNKEVWMKIARLAHRHHESRLNAWMASTKMLKDRTCNVS